MKRKKFLDLKKSAENTNPMRSDAHRVFCDEGYESVLYSRGKVSNAFYTEDSKRYVTPKEMRAMGNGIMLDRRINKWDALSSRVLKNYQRYQPKEENVLSRALEKRIEMLRESVDATSQTLARSFSLVRLWNISIVGAILFGMVTMTMIYRYLGQGASAGNVAAIDPSVQTSQILSVDAPRVLGAQNQRMDIDELTSEAMAQLAEEEKQEKFETQAREMVKGYPIEKMLPYIFEKDRTVASFLIAIAKKESNWGKRVPVLDGQDCYNLWGYRGKRKLMGTGGHTCFNSRKDAVDTVAKRITTLVEKEKLDTPEKMIVWKCGSSCAGHGSYDVQKWINDVDMYYGKLNSDTE